MSAPAPGSVAEGGEPPPQVRGRRGGVGASEGVSRNGSEGPESLRADSESSNRGALLIWADPRPRG